MKLTPADTFLFLAAYGDGIISHFISFYYIFCLAVFFLLPSNSPL